MKFVTNILAVLAMLFAIPAFAQQAPEQGYTLLSPPQPTQSGKKIEVLEFFFYGCPHCFHLHPALSAWEKKMPKDVELTLVPTIFNPNWEPMANTFYALEALGKQKELHDALYQAWAGNNILVEKDTIADFVAKHGVDKQKFTDLYNSFSVQSKVTRSKQMTVGYHIQGTPTLIVDGKYVITGLQPDETIRVLDEVIRMARKERTGRH